METDIKDPIMPTSDNSSDEHEKSMCESDASDVSVTEHITPLHTGEGQGVGLHTNIIFAVKKCYKLKSDSRDLRHCFYSFLCVFVSVSAMQPCPYFFISLPLLRE